MSRPGSLLRREPSAPAMRVRATLPDAGPTRARLAAIGVIVLCAALPLQWQTVLTVPSLGTLRYFHLAAVVMLVLALPTWRSLAPLLRESRVVLAGAVAFTACCLVAAVGWASDPADYVQRTVYLVLGLLAGACLLIALSDVAGRRLLVWASAAAIVVFAVNFYRAMQLAGVDPLGTIEAAVANGDPGVIEFSLFRSSFNASGVTTDVRSNARHEIFAALVVVFAISLVAGAVTRAARVVLVVSGVLTFALLVISQSRSVGLAVVLALAVAFVQLVVTRRIKAGTIVIGALVIGAAFVAFPVLGPLIIKRLTQTQSYDARIGAINDLTGSEIVQRLAFGGPALDPSTHTLIGDAAMRGGIMAGIGAAVMTVGLLAIAVTCVRGYFRGPSLAWFAAILGMSIALVRSFTAGGGQLQLPEWLGVGLALVVIVSDRIGPRPAPNDAEPGADLERTDSAGAPAPRRRKISAGV